MFSVFHNEKFPKISQFKCWALPYADSDEIHAIVSRIFGKVKDRFSNEDDMCELNFDEQCALVKTIVDNYILNFQYILCHAVLEQARKVTSIDCDAKSVVDSVLQEMLVEDVLFDISHDLFSRNCNISPLITQLATELTPLFRMVPRLIVRFRKQCAVCARVPETVVESLDEDWDDSQDALLEENETLLKTLLNRKELAFYNAFCPKNSKAKLLDLQIRLFKRLQSQDVDMEVAGTSLGKRQDRDQDGSDGAGLETGMGKRKHL